MIPIDELKKMTKNELSEEIKKAIVELLKLRLSVSSRQSKEVSKFKSLRKYIARIKTLKHMFMLDKAPENPAAKL